MKERKAPRVVDRLVTNTDPPVVLFVVWRPEKDDEYAAESDMHDASIRGQIR
jgi:hypothetical protein